MSDNETNNNETDDDNSYSPVWQYFGQKYKVHEKGKDILKVQCMCVENNKKCGKHLRADKTCAFIFLPLNLVCREFNESLAHDTRYNVCC